MMAGENESKSVVSANDVEKEIVRSLAGDARAVARVCTDIVSWTGSQSVERPSWSNPGRNVSLQIYLKDTPPGSKLHYTPALEQTIDIVHIFLESVIGYMNQIPNVSEAFSCSDMAVPSKRMSLPALVWMLWSRVKFINSELHQQVVRRNDVHSHRLRENFSQTRESSMKVCESCQISQETVSLLMAALEKLCIECKLKTTAIARTRKEMESEIYNITQLGAMSKWCKAILKDMQLVADSSKELKSQNVKLTGQLRTYRTESLLTVSKLKDLNKEKEELIVTTEKAVESRASSTMKANELNRKCRVKTAECEDWKQKFHELEAASAEMKNEVSELRLMAVKEKEKNIQLCQEVQRKTSATDAIKQEMNRMKKEFSSLTYSLKDDIASRDLTISNQLDKMKLLEEKLREAERKTEDLTRELNREKAHGLEIWKSLEKLKIEKKAQDEKLEKNYAEMDEMLRRLNEVENSILAMPNILVPVTGDPVQDMVCKKTRNEMTIKHLKEENFRLTRALNKMCSVSGPDQLKDSAGKVSSLTEDSNLEKT